MDVTLSGNSFIFKTINEKEASLAKLYAGKDTRKSFEVRYDAYFLALSIFLQGNNNVIVDREKNLPILYDLLIELPATLRKKLVIEMNNLRVMSYDCLKFLEGFIYTKYSKRMWNILRGHFPNEVGFTGIKGTVSMGLNAHQESWVYMNGLIDREEENDKDFSNALFIASATNPKGSKKVRADFNKSMQETSDYRNDLALRGFVEEDSKWSQDGWAIKTDTAEDLVAELNRQMEGKKDRHDLFIDSHLKSIRERAEAKAADVERRLKKVRESRGDDNWVIRGEQRVLTPEESANLMKDKKVYTQRVISDDSASSASKKNFLKKIGSRVLTGKV